MTYHSLTCLVSILVLVLVAGGTQTSLGLFTVTFGQSLVGTGWQDLRQNKTWLFTFVKGQESFCNKIKC